MGTLVLVRHGQSLWNKQNLFTGWVDVPLSPQGINEALEAGERLKNMAFDIVYTSVQIRAIETAMLLLSKNITEHTPIMIHEDENDKMTDWTKIYNEDVKVNMLPVYTNWHLNERYYGDLQGKNKAQTATEYGEEKVHEWRRSFDTPPPHGESLKDTSERTIPFFKEVIVSQLEEGKTILVSAHGNSLRSIIMEIEHLSKEEVTTLELPTGAPICYTFKEGKFIKNENS
ncbi:2,3-bisphosphoglycerate-dependent phosphoglycerate mutase [Zhouia sp. PK063]|uniref:2,3-bisphosphoglycerate-dependent phosphoglycerate mutase n=1 Tax=Zhouia sp. PK063 TaxID=3373602 RepID=UPI003792CA26